MIEIGDTLHGDTEDIPKASSNHFHGGGTLYMYKHTRLALICFDVPADPNIRHSRYNIQWFSMILPSASHVMNENCSCLASNCRELLARSWPVWHRGAVISFWTQATTWKTVRRLTLDSPGMAARDSFVHMEMDAEDMEESRIQRYSTWTAVWVSSHLFTSRRFKKSGHWKYLTPPDNHCWLSKVADFKWFQIHSDPLFGKGQVKWYGIIQKFIIPGN